MCSNFSIFRNMAYVPPHKRRPKEGDEGSSNTPPPKPALPPRCFKKEDMGYAYEDIFKWFAVGLDQSNHFPPSVHLQPVSVKSLEAEGKILQRRALIKTNLTESERQ